MGRDGYGRDRNGGGGGGRGGGRGHGGGGRGRGGGGGRGRGHGGGGRGRGGPRGGRRGSRDQAASGNKRERIAVESGNLVLIDQFMLANPQFNDKLVELIDSEPEQKDELVRGYGGDVFSVAPGTYRIERNPYKYKIIIHPDGERVREDDFEIDQDLAQTR